MTELTPPDNQELVDALQAAAADSSSGAGDGVRRALGEAKLLVPLLDFEAAAEPSASFLAVQLGDAEPELPVFSSMEAFGRWGVTDPFAAVDAADLLAFARSRGLTRVVIDPAGPVSVVLEEDDLAALTETAS
jgi:SseB protein N-terminal domain